VKQVVYAAPQSDMAVKDVSPAKAYAPARHSSDDVGVEQPLASHDVPLENVVQVPGGVLVHVQWWLPAPQAPGLAAEL